MFQGEVQFLTGGKGPFSKKKRFCLEKGNESASEEDCWVRFAEPVAFCKADSGTDGNCKICRSPDERNGWACFSGASKRL